ncbi:5-amino-6-(5-phosphoribosylamino)uracil reductase [Tamaricihabitans halophyticus]|uniref:5-amino-6-(5-phosphoribosylamino)uracil reductase n=1 Tax=Tamaricihabitans halophyticus TaxID=1262583 RepID=A0A4R2R0N9_9PSEU|nr:pyrimidine reductase family protein [Tamaricihabitans halophyticus]TCP55284.1 5-amino-6-(5-phosphoribosylamino)uracil reductase [Tamaricihabitans halophyticus]
MRSLLSSAGAGPGEPDRIGEADLARLYAYPTALERAWVQVNFVSSADGAVSVAGTSDGLSSEGDRRVFLLGRDLADVILVGAQTVTSEDYRPVPRTPRKLARRRRFGFSDVAPIAVVTASCTLAPSARLFSDRTVPPIIVTCAAAPEHRRARLAAAGARILLAGDDRVELPTALRLLHEQGLSRVCCEGGPRLFGQLIEQDLVDQLCLTVAPLLASGTAGRIATGTEQAVPRALRLDSVLHDEDFLLLRYRRRGS